MASLYGGARDSWGQKRIPKLCFVSLFERTTIPLGRKSSSEHTVGEQEHRTYTPPHSTALRSMIEASTAHSARMQRTAHSAQRTAHSTQSIIQHYIAQWTTFHYIQHSTIYSILLYTAFYDVLSLPCANFRWPVRAISKQPRQQSVGTEILPNLTTEDEGSTAIKSSHLQ